MVLLSSLDDADKHARLPPLRHRRRKCAESRRRRQLGSSLFLAAALFPSSRHPNLAAATSHQHQEQYLLRHRRDARQQQHQQQPETEETNDDDHTVISLLPFSIRLSDVPPTSPLAIVNANWLIGTPDVDSLLKRVNELGAAAFESSELYGKRFRSWDAGEAWTSKYFVGPLAAVGGSPSMPAAADSRGGDAAAAAKSDDSWQGSVFGGDGRSLLNGPAVAGTGGGGGGAEEGTTLLTLGGNGTVTFDGAYWEDDPTPEDLTDFLVSRLDSNGGRAGMLDLVRPLACEPEEIIGMDCHVGVEVTVIADDASAVGVAAGGEVEAEEATEGGAQAEILADADEDEALGGTATDVATDPGPSRDDDAAADQTAADGINASGGESTGGGDGGANVGEGAPDGEAMGGNDAAVPGDGGLIVNKAAEAKPPQAMGGDGGGGSRSSALKWIIPVTLGAVLLAFLIAGLLYRRRRDERRKRGLAVKDGLLEELATEDQVDPNAAAAAYDAITGGEMAVVSPTPEETKATREIDNILEDFSSDGDSSYISGDTSENNASTTSGLTGILSDGMSATRLDHEARKDSRLSNYSAGSAARDEGGYLPKIPQRGGSTATGAAAAAVRVRRQESFEGTYRTRSAMAKLNLKKDILHVQDEAGDGGGGKGGKGGYTHGNATHGVTRTVSPKKSGSMMEKQRLAEKLHLRPPGLGRGDGGSVRSRTSRGRPPRTTRGPRPGSPPPSRPDFDREKMKEEELREEKESSKDPILPMGFRKSDSVDLEPRSGGAEGDASSNFV